MEARSWFRDQVMHPHETQHTLREISEWLTGAGLTLQSTSINAFAPIGDVALLFAQEPVSANGRAAPWQKGGSSRASSPSWPAGRDRATSTAAGTRNGAAGDDAAAGRGLAGRRRLALPHRSARSSRP
jgi:hypothetical protein